ncbi:MAG: anthranilate synthase component 1 [Gammaproteobacteria bacterium]|nr:anthranilate synthase component 1 [Gammaproteobacteria bacterium]
MESTKTLSSKVNFPKSVTSVYHRLKDRFESPTALLETASISTKEHTRSIAMLSAALSIECVGFNVKVKALNENGAQFLPEFKQLFLGPENLKNGFKIEIPHANLHSEVDERKKLCQSSVMDVLRKVMEPLKVQASDDRTTMLIGTFAFDIYELFESLNPLEDEPEFPHYIFYLADTLLEVDHLNNSARVHTKVFPGKKMRELQNDYQRRLSILNDFFENDTDTCDVLQAINTDFEALVTSTSGNESSSNNQKSLSKMNFSKKSLSTGSEQVNVLSSEFASRVEKAKKHIIDGDIFQIVLARDFKLPCNNAFLAYQYLRQQNPSPYMFYIEDSSYQLFGASPESAVKYESESRLLSLYPIAGTRKRGLNADGTINHDLDARIELELKNDEKERSEHLMLVDLGRNDIARVCQSGTRKIERLLEIDRYSHVMHLVSKVSGTLCEELDALSAYQACMNMGTLSGAPKVKATQLIRTIEQQYRGAYGGAMGYINAAGDMDTAIVIRSALVKDCQATVSAGAGIVFDSVSELEIKETENKAAAVIQAINQANQIAVSGKRNNFQQEAADV